MSDEEPDVPLCPLIDEKNKVKDRPMSSVQCAPVPSRGGKT